MRQALARRVAPRRQHQPQWQGEIGFVPAPVGGWDTDTPAPELDAVHARVFDNWLPRGQSVRIREGYTQWVTGGSTTVETLMNYASPSGSFLFAAAGTSVYDVSSAGALGAAVLTSMGNARFSYTNITTSGGSYLWICNGSAAPRHWSGAAWATPSLSLTTYASTDINYVFTFKERLFVIFKNSMTMGYFATQSIAGTVSNFPLGAVFNFGGHLVAMNAISLDGGSGIDDNLVILTSEGEIAVYQGTNPGDSTAWSLIGTYYVGEPIGDRPLVDLGDDLGVITVAGLVSVKAVMATSDQAAAPLTQRISVGWQTLSNAGRSFSGWEGVFFPARDVLLINAPVTSTTAYQVVRYRPTQGYSRFTGWNFACFEVYGANLYAGGYDGVIYKCFDGYADNSADITAAWSQGWTTLGSPVRKTLLEARVIITAVTRAVVRMIARADFASTPALNAWPASTVTNALIWDSASTFWGSNLWGGEDTTSKGWRAISGEGHSLSLVLEARANESPLDVNGVNLRYTTGGQV